MEGDGFYISYNPDPLGPETALVKDGKFLILDGDFRKEYEERVESFEECLKFFKDHQDRRSRWSDWRRMRWNYMTVFST